MQAQELLEQFRDVAVDVVAEGYLWGDEELLRFVDEAQTRFCRNTRGIADSITAEVTQIPVVTGESYANLHNAVMTIREARRSDGTVLRLFNTDTVASVCRDDYGIFSPRDAYDVDGPLFGMVLGDTDGKVRWLNKPVADDTVFLKVLRKNINRLDSPTSTLEVPEEYAWVLLDYMLYKALRKRDAELFNADLSNDYLTAFNSGLADVRRDQERTVHRDREMQYGGL